MTFTTALLKIPRVISLHSVSEKIALSPDLLWRQNSLFVSATGVTSTATKVCESELQLLALRNSQWFEACLQKSPVNSVCLDMAIGELSIKEWAETCVTVKKRAYVRLPTATYLPRIQSPLFWKVKRIADFVVGALIMLVLSPLLLALAAIVYCDSPGSVFFYQWRVGHRGQLFKVVKFRTMCSDAEKMHHQVMGEQTGLHKLEDDPRVTRSGRWLRKYSLDELPQLFNVLLGEMSLVGPRPLALYDAIRINSENCKRLNALPGMTGFWQVEMRSNQRDIDVVCQVDVDYLQTWSLLKDLRILLLTFPKVLKGFGAF